MPRARFSLCVLVLVILLVLTTAGPVLAQTGAYAQSSGAVYVRGGPGTGFFVITTLSTGEIVPINGVSPDGGWWYVNTQIGPGWVSNIAVTAYNTVDVPVMDPGPIGIVVPSLLNVRSGAGTEAASLGKLSRGEQVYVVGQNANGTWLEIQWAYGTGWVSTSMLAVTGDIVIVTDDTEDVGDADVLPVTAGEAYGVVLVAYLNVRGGPSINYSVLGHLYGGQEVPIVGRTNDKLWYQVEASFGTGWVYAEYLLPRNEYGSSPVTSADVEDAIVDGPIGVINTGALNIRSGPGPNYTSIGAVPGGEEALIIGRSADWSWWLMETSVGTGWASAVFVVVRGDNGTVPYAEPGTTIPAGTAQAGGEAPEAVAGLPEAVINTGALNIRSGPNSAFPSLGVAYMGERFPILGQSPDLGWWLVETAFGDGWVSKAMVITSGDITGVTVQ